MPVVKLTTNFPELAWELRISDEVVGRVEALDGETVWISRISVQPPHRGCGYGSLLLRAVLDHFPDTVIGLAASPVPGTEPGFDQSELSAWYTRYGFVPAPLRGDPHRMLRSRPSDSGRLPTLVDRPRTGS